MAVAHFLIVAMIFYSKRENVLASVAVRHDQSEYDDNMHSMNGALAVCLVCFAIEAISFFGGFSMFNLALSTLQIAAHMSASVALSFFVVEKWHYLKFWHILAFASVIPAMLELACIFSVFCCQRRKW